MKAADGLQQSNTCTGVPLGGEPATIKENFQSLHAAEIVLCWRRRERKKKDRVYREECQSENARALSLARMHQNHRH